MRVSRILATAATNQGIYSNASISCPCASYLSRHNIRIRACAIVHVIFKSIEVFALKSWQINNENGNNTQSKPEWEYNVCYNIELLRIARALTKVREEEKIKHIFLNIQCSFLRSLTVSLSLSPAVLSFPSRVAHFYEGELVLYRITTKLVFFLASLLVWVICKSKSESRTYVTWTWTRMSIALTTKKCTNLCIFRHLIDFVFDLRRTHRHHSSACQGQSLWALVGGDDAAPKLNLQIYISIPICIYSQNTHCG